MTIFSSVFTNLAKIILWQSLFKYSTAVKCGFWQNSKDLLENIYYHLFLNHVSKVYTFKETYHCLFVC